jgi:HK97 family phage prohead protease
MTVEDLLFEAVAWWRITGFGWDGYPVSAVRYEPGQVSMNPPSRYEHGLLPSYLPTEGAVWMAGHPVPWAEVIRFSSPNPGILVAGQRTIKRAIALDQAADLYAKSPRMRGFFAPSDETVDPATDDKIVAMLNAFADARARSIDGYVPAALKYNPIQDPTPAELQIIEQQKRVDLQLANMMGLDPADMGISTNSNTYNNGVDKRRDRINDTLAPYMKAITDRLTMPDVTRRGTTVRFWLDDYLKADPRTRAEVQQIQHGMQVIDAQDIQRAEGLPPRTIQAPAPAVDGAALAPRRVPSSTGDPVKPLQAADPAPFTFAYQAGITFDYQPDGAFAVDAEARTVTGLAVPWGQTALFQGRRYRFAKGGIKYSAVNRIKLLRDHITSSALGKCTRLWETDEGLMATFKVSPGPAGDAALALAADEVLDGLSVGVDWRQSDLRPDPLNAGALLVTRSALREVSLTAVPAFDDSRLTSVTASRNGGTMHVCEHCHAELTPGVAHTCPTPAAAAAAAVTLSDDQFTALMNRGAPPAAAEPVEPRPTVNPTTAATFVSEPAPYRFDRQGNLHAGSHDFGRDVIAGLRDGDQAAYDRAMGFVSAQFDVVTTNVNELNPTRNRPDMYVDQRAFQYPIWNAINKGTLSDITPFTFPKFSSASGLVGAHTEGVEPTSGAFVTTLDTVTPTAVSGKAKISRETWDQGGNPQIGNLIWRQMLKGWFEALEAAAVAVLDAASPTQIDFSGSPGLANDDLDQALTAALAGLQFIRGGFTMDTAFAQIDLFKALVAATATDGRRLYPALGPANANGTVRGRWSGVDVNGVAFLPAWALAATGTVSASSYLFDREDVHGWASPPRRLTIDNTEVANVYIGIWGYKATVISDLAGVRELVYDPA